MKPFTEVLDAYLEARDLRRNDGRDRYVAGNVEAYISQARDSLNRFFDVQRLLCMGWKVKPHTWPSGEHFWIWSGADGTFNADGSHDDVPTIPPELVEMLR